jgi:hypothetical protein
MKVNAKNESTGESYDFIISYVKEGSDKRLVVIDESTKKKYVPDTWISNFDEADGWVLINQFINNILKWDKLDNYSWDQEGKVTFCCKYGDFENNYRKKYKYLGPDESGIAY